MVDKLSNPHDKITREILSQKQEAQSFLHHYLPPQVSALLDLDSLEIRKDTFIGPDLQEHFSDLLYEVALHQAQPLYVYLLFEHKSYVDPAVPFQDSVLDGPEFLFCNGENVAVFIMNGSGVDIH